MNRIVVRFVIAAGLVGASIASASAEDAKSLPTLLIKGEVVSVDTADPATPLLKVKDRYGFETPIYLSQSAKIAQGDQALTSSDLTPGKTVEVEYNFDITTAKRQAVNVKVVTPTASASIPAASAAASTAAPEAMAQPAVPASDTAASAPAETPSEQPAATTK